MRHFKKLFSMIGAALVISTPVYSMEDIYSMKEEVIEIVFHDGKKATYNGSGISFKSLNSGPVCLTDNFQANSSVIQYGNLTINRTVPLSEAVKQIQATSGIKSAVLHTIPLPLDDRFKIAVDRFNKTSLHSLPDQQKVESFRNFYILTQKYQQEGSETAAKNIPVLQSILGIHLANLSNSQKGEECITSLREAVNLLEESLLAKDAQTKRAEGEKDKFLSKILPTLSPDIAGLLGKNHHSEISEDMQNTIKNTCEANFLLGVALVNFGATEQPSKKPSRLIREGMKFIDRAQDLGKKGIDDQILPIQKLLIDSLIQELAEIISDSKKGKVPFWVLPKAIEEEEVYQNEGLLNIYLGILADPEIQHLTKLGLVESYSHPMLLYGYLLADNARIEMKFVKMLVENKPFMTQYGVPFFSKLFRKKGLSYEIKDIFNPLVENNCFKIDDMVTLVCTALQDRSYLSYIYDDTVSYCAKLPAYKVNIHGIKIAQVVIPYYDPSVKDAFFMSHHAHLLKQLGLK